MRPNHFYLDKEFEVTIKVRLDVPDSVSYSEAVQIVTEELKNSKAVTVKGHR